MVGLGIDLFSRDAVDRRILNLEGALVRGRLRRPRRDPGQ